MFNDQERKDDTFEVNNHDSMEQGQVQDKEVYVESIQRDVPNLNENPNMYSNVNPNWSTVDENSCNRGEGGNEPPKKKNSIANGAIKIVASAAVFGLVAGGIFQGVNYISYRNTLHDNALVNQNQSADEDSVTSALQTGTKDPGEYSGVSLIVENAKPSIVAITSTVKEVAYDFFGRPNVSEASGAGSGIIIGQSQDEILIVTNNHVISNAQSIVIQFNDETTATATVKGAEAGSDLAVVSVKTKDLSKDTLGKIKIASLGDSDTVKEGELVVAIGNALGYGQSSTVGYISALNREVTVSDDTTLNLLQTDAAINPGNSGGALINSKGEVIGINSVKYVNTDVEGVGYSIPISQAIPIINDLMNREVLSESEKSYLGIRGEDVTEVYAKQLGLPIGVYVNAVVEKSPAAKAGINPGDVIVEIAGRSIKTQQELQSYLNYTRAGQTTKVKVMTLVEGEYVEKTVDVVLGSK